MTAAGDDRPALEPGATVDAYTVIRRVGRGGMGEVYLARDTDLGRKVALKVLHHRGLEDQNAVDRFLFEARTTARFNHPHIVTVYGVGTVGGRPYVALEFLAGQTLRERMRASPPVGREILRIGLAIAEALREAHRHQILHRDLKPSNVMIPRDGRIRVVDFGLALRVDPGDVPALDTSDSGHLSETMLQSSRELFDSAGTGMRGTPMYMAPEQWAERPATGATDVWALGLMLWELTAGKHPFVGAGLYQLCARVISTEPVPVLPEDVEPRLRDLVSRCVDKVPDHRPPVTEVVTTLEELIHGTSTRAIRRRGPFHGLLPCEERDADLFFGRDAEIDTFLERLRAEPVLPVVGASGAAAGRARPPRGGPGAAVRRPDRGARNPRTGRRRAPRVPRRGVPRRRRSRGPGAGGLHPPRRLPRPPRRRSGGPGRARPRHRPAQPGSRRVGGDPDPLGGRRRPGPP